MRSKRRRLVTTACSLCFLSFASLVKADVDPRSVKVDKREYDLSALTETQTLESSLDSPPTKTITRFYVSLWTALPRLDGTADSDQCPADSRICAIITNEKSGENPRVTSVIPIAGEYGDRGKLDISSSGTSDSAGDFLLTYSGGSYMNIPQRAEIVFRCQSDATESKPELDSYANGLLKLKWSSSHACALGDSKDSNPPLQVGSGRSVFTIFFWLVVIAFVAYFIVGAWINKTQYGASGLDMLPNRDFWRDIPFIVKEFFTPSRSARAGYSSLG